MNRKLTVNSKFIRKRMVDLDLSNYDLARRMRVMPSTVWRMLNNRLKSGITARTTGKLLNALGLDTNDLNRLFIFK